MKIHDISLSIQPGMPVWPGDPSVELERISSIDEGAHANVSRLACGVHTGTHVDAPNHFLNDQRTVENLDLEVLTGPALVIQIPDEILLVTSDVLEKATIPPGTTRLLLKTRNSHIWEEGKMEFFTNFTGISPDAAEWLVRKGVRLVGIDYLSIAPYKQGTPAHQVLLIPGVIILEGVDLSKVDPGEYDIYCLPLKLMNSDGAPARAILVGG